MDGVGRRCSKRLKGFEVPKAACGVSGASEHNGGCVTISDSDVLGSEVQFIAGIT